MDNTATPETGPVDAPVTVESILADIEAAPAPDTAEDIVAELVKETEGDGQAKAPETEESATDPIEPDKEAPDATPETDEADPPADDPTVKVKVNGEEVEVPLSEALKGYSRTEDYKAKTMALADERRVFDQAKATVETDVRSQYANELRQNIAEFEALDPVLSEARQIDWDKLKAEDPATFVQYSDAVNARLAFIEQHRGKLAQFEQDRVQNQAAQAQAETALRMDIAANKIVELMPELKEGNAFQQFATDNIGYLRETGFTPEEISDAIDDRALIMADKARKWDALQRAKTGLPGRKIVPKSAVKTMTSDASDSTRAMAKRLSPNAGTEERIAYILNELQKE